jgi:murein DD-endopeptidase MepM/ murein hydrolase activator NlpD
MVCSDSCSDIVGAPRSVLAKKPLEFNRNGNLAPRRRRTPSHSRQKFLNSYRRLPTICHNPPNSDNYGDFVIRDYKSSLVTGHTKGKGPIRIFAAIAVLAGAIATVRYLDPATLLAAVPDPAPADATVTLDLTLPTNLAATDPLPLAAADVPQPPVDVAALVPAEQQEAATPLVAAPHPQLQIAGEADVEALPSLLQEAAEEIEPPSAVETVALVEPLPAAPQPEWKEHRIAKGESLARIFAQYELDAGLLHRIVNSSEEAKSLARIRPGQRLRFLFDENRELTRLELHRNRVDSLRVAIADDAIDIEQISKDIEKRIGAAAGVIESSLFVDGQKAGLSDGQIMELAAVFGWDIDFALEIRAGDQFRVIYEEHYLDGEKLRDGAILAAEFTNRGTTHHAVRYEDGNGEVGYYDVEGHNKRRAFIRTPIKFARVSSRYNPKRWHPVLKRWRSHKGVDYAAPTGTPVKATGDGRVVFRGTKGGYGRTVILEHAGKYTTLYAHLSNYSKRARQGQRVKQGQVIGYVGKSGLATGPHLHYEFRVNGMHKDPLRVKLPKSLSLPKSELAAFRKATAPLLARLETMPADTMVASAESIKTP